MMSQEKSSLDCQIAWNALAISTFLDLNIEEGNVRERRSASWALKAGLGLDSINVRYLFMTRNCHERSFKVIQGHKFGTNGKPVCYFLLVNNYNSSPVSHRLGDATTHNDEFVRPCWIDRRVR